MTTITLDEKYTRADGTVFMTGVQALVRLALEHARRDRRAGVRTAMLITGYPGSPLAGLDLELGRRATLLAELDVQHRPALNEELAATAIVGSQLASADAGARYEGVVGMWYGKAPGFDRATDAVRHANLIGVDALGGALAVVGDDALSKSSTLPSSSETAFFDTLVPFVAPGDPQEVVDLGLHAIALSRASGLWAGMKVATSVADGSGTVDVGTDRVRPAVPQLTLDGAPYRHRPTARLVAPITLELERTLHDARLVAARSYGTLNGLNRTVFARPDDRLGIVAAGKVHLEVREALSRLGLDDDALRALPVRLFKVGLPFPLDPAAVREFARGLEQVVVIEEKRAFLELFVKDALYATADAPAVLGKHDERGARLVPADRELDAAAIATLLEPRLRPWHTAPPAAERIEVLGDGPPPALPMRTPWFCSGCPHNSSTKVPEGALVGGGIGCHGMVLLMAPERVGNVVGLTQMGGEGAQWIGMAPFTETRHFIQNLGDGTFLHSGSLGIRAAVAAGVDITFKILHNSAVAMTGGQQAVGTMDVPSMTRLLESEGVKRTIVTTEDRSRYRGVRLAANAEVWDRRRVVEAQETLAAVRGVTALVHDQECAAELRRKRKRGRAPNAAQRVFINQRVCEGCGDCGAKSNCLSVQPVDTEFGLKTQIHQASCNVDLSCLEGDCPSFVTVVPSKKRRGRGERVAPLERDSLPEPAARPALPWTTRIVGAGGTGVVTVAQVLGTAALLDGLVVRGLDQTGLAQKGGPVVSDLRLFAEPTEEGNKATGGTCDLYVGCDLLASADPRHLAAASGDRTAAVVSTAQVPTGSMIGNGGARFPATETVRERLDAATRADANAYLDPQALTTALFGSDRSANVLLLGVAYQRGLVPVAADAIERAIELNGASIDENVQAFRRGRQWVTDHGALEAARRGGASRRPEPTPPSPAVRRLIDAVGAPAGSELERVVSIRIPDLVAYHDGRYAARYADFVASVRSREWQRAQSMDLTLAVAGQLHRLMAFKDEYEVARLHLDPAFGEEIRAEFGEGARIHWHLHPPALRALGLDRKVRLGRWFTVPYRLLRAMRRLRFTPFDPFGRAEVRKVERRLIDNYRAMIDAAVDGLTPERHAATVELATLPETIRGYEDIKLRSVERYRERVAELQARLQGTR